MYTLSEIILLQWIWYIPTLIILIILLNNFYKGLSKKIFAGYILWQSGADKPSELLSQFTYY